MSRTQAASPPASAQGNGHNRQADPKLGKTGAETQPFASVINMPIGLDEGVRSAIVDMLNPLLADTMTLRDLYKKHHWQVAGPTFYQLHLLFDKHFGEQVALVDELAERIQILGGISVAMPHDIIEVTRIPRAPKGREDPPAQITRLLEAHEIVLRDARRVAREAANKGDDGTNDLIVSNVVRTNEMQVWFLAEHLVAAPLVR